MMPRPPLTTVAAVMMPDRIHSIRKSTPPGGKSASSKTERMSNGLTTPSPAVTRISSTTPMTCGV